MFRLDPHPLGKSLASRGGDPPDATAAGRAALQPGRGRRLVWTASRCFSTSGKSFLDTTLCKVGEGFRLQDRQGAGPPKPQPRGGRPHRPARWPAGLPAGKGLPGSLGRADPAQDASLGGRALATAGLSSLRPPFHRNGVTPFSRIPPRVSPPPAAKPGVCLGSGPRVLSGRDGKARGLAPVSPLRPNANGRFWKAARAAGPQDTGVRLGGWHLEFPGTPPGSGHPSPQPAALPRRAPHGSPGRALARDAFDQDGATFPPTSGPVKVTHSHHAQRPDHTQSPASGG